MYTVRKSFTYSVTGLERAYWVVEDSNGVVVDGFSLKRDAVYWARKWNEEMNVR